MPAWRWPLALLAAAGLHVLLFAALPEPREPPGAEAEGERGLLIALAPDGGTPGDAGDAVPETAVEPEPPEAADPQPEPLPEPEAVVEPEAVTEPETVPEPETVAEPEPVDPEPVEPEPVEPQAEDAPDFVPEPVEPREETAAAPGTDAAAAPGTDAAAGVETGQERGEADGTDTGGGDPGAVADYHAKLQAHLARYKRYPRQAQRRREEGVVMLAFTVHADGAVSAAEIVAGSGSRLLDDAALDMLERATPLPEFTDGIAAERLRIEVPVSYSLR